MKIAPSMVAHFYDSHICKAEEDHYEFKANLGCGTKTCLKRLKQILKIQKENNTLANTTRHVFRLMGCMQCHFRECNLCPWLRMKSLGWVGSIHLSEENKVSSLFHLIDTVEAPSLIK